MTTYTGTLEAPTSFASGSTLDGVTLLGSLNLSAGGITVYVKDGLTVETAGAAVPGTIDLTGQNTVLFFFDSETLDNTAIAFGSTADLLAYTGLTASNNSTLTLGGHATLTISAVGQYGINTVEFDGGTLVNAGIVNAGSAAVSDLVASFINAGTVALTSGDTFTVQNTSFTNTGLISVGAGATLDFTGLSSQFFVAGTIANTGTITVASGGTLEVGGSVALGQLGTVITGGTGLIDFTGTRDLQGGTLDVAAGGEFGDLEISGTVKNGTIVEDGGTLTVASGATLDGITLLGSLDISDSNEYVYVEGGLHVETAAGGVPGTINMSGDNATPTLEFLDSETLDNVVIAFGSPGDNYYTYLESASGSTLTLGAQAVLASAEGENWLGGTLVNLGQINETGGNIYDNAQSFTNAGTISLSGTAAAGGPFGFGSNFIVENGESFANSRLISVASGGILEVADGANFTNTGSIVIASGGKLEIDNGDGFTNTGTIVDSSGGEILLGGSLTLAQLNAFAAGVSGLINVSGTLDLQGGTLDAAAFPDIEISGLAKNGTIQTSGGASTIASGTTLDAITLLGSLDISGMMDRIEVEGGLNVETTAGGTPGTINLTGAYSALSFLDSETLDNVVIAFGNSASASSLGGNTLTLGSNVVVSGTANGSFNGTIVNLGEIIETGGDTFVSSGSFTNAGTIAVGGTAAAGGNFGNEFGADSGATFVNTGLINVASGGILDIASGATVTNTGTIMIASGGEILLSAASPFASSGTATLAELGAVDGAGVLYFYNGETLNLGGGTLFIGGSTLDSGAGPTFHELAAYGTVINGTIVVGSGGTIVGTGTFTGVTTLTVLPQITISATDNLAGGTLDIKPGTANANVLLTGTLANGTVILDGGTLDYGNGAVLDGITLRGSLDLATPYVTVFAKDGLTVETQAGGQPGTINLAAGTLGYLDSETLDNTAILFGGGAAAPAIDVLYGNTLTLGSHDTLSVSGSGVFEGISLVNRGVIALNAGTITDYLHFTNAGTMSLAAGTVFDAANGLFANTGTIAVAAGATLELGGTIALAQLGSIAVAPGGVLDFTGTLDLGGATLDVKPATEFGVVAFTGAVKNGTIKPDGGTLLIAPGATVEGITYLGTLNLNVAGSSIDVVNGLTVETAAGAEPGTINVTGAAVGVTFLDSETLDHVAVNVHPGSAGSAIFDVAGGNTLTFGADAVIAVSTGVADFEGQTLVNLGSLNATGGAVGVYTTVLTNTGTTTLSGTATETVYSPTIDNAALISIGAGTALYLQDPTQFTNTGSIAIADGGLLVIGGSLTLAQLASIGAGSSGQIEFTGTLDLGGGTLDIAPGTAFADVTIAGTVENGTIEQNGGTLTLASGAALSAITDFVGNTTLSQLETLTAGTTGGVVEISGTLDLQGGTLDVKSGSSLGDIALLGEVKNGTIKPDGGTLLIAPGATVDGITYLGTLNLNVPGTSLDVLGGLTIETASGGQPGTINITGTSVGVSFLDSETLDHVTINVKPQSAGTAILTGPTGGTLTLGSNAVLAAATGIAFVGSDLVNMGSVLASGGVFSTRATSFTNDATVQLSGTVAMDIYGGTVGNAGLISIGAGSTLDIEPGTTFANTGSIAVASGGTLEFDDALTLAQAGAIGTTGSGLVLFTNSIDLQGGTLDVKPANGTAIGDVQFVRTVSDGTLIADGGSITLGTYAELDSIDLAGSFAATGTYVYLLGNLGAVPGTTGIGATLDLAANDIQLDPLGRDTIDHIELLTGGPGTNTDFFVNDSAYALTFGAAAQLVENGGYIAFSGDGASETIVNDGAMRLTDGFTQISASNFTNAGTIMLAGTEELAIYQGGGFVNDGLITVGPAATVLLSGSFDNAGSLALTTGSTLYLNNDITLAALGAVGGGGTLDIGYADTLDLGGGTLEIGPGHAFSSLVLDGAIVDGTLIEDSTTAVTVDRNGTIGANVTLLTPGTIGPQTTITGLDNLAGGTLDIAPGTTMDNVLLAGTLANGTLLLAGGVFTFGPGATLDGVTYRGLLDLSPAGTTIDVENGLTVETASGGQPGTINLTGTGSELYAAGATTLDHMVIDFGSTAPSYPLSGYSALSGETLTLGDGAVLNAVGNATLGFLASSLVNAGVINASGGNLSIQSGTFTNAGTIAVTGTANAAVSDSFDNTGLVTIGSGALFQFQFGSSPIANTGSIVVGSGAELVVSGTFSLAQLGSLSGGGLVDVVETMDLAGGTFSTGTLEAYTDIVGPGTVSAALELAYGGTIDAKGGLLDIASAPNLPTNHGLFEIDSASTLELGQGTPTSAEVLFDGAGATLKLDTAAASTGTLTGIAAGDTIVLAGETVTGASSIGNSLTIDVASGGPFVYSLAAPLTGLTERVTLGNDGISFDVAACYLCGTRIATPSGERPIESLAIGDLVTTASGQAVPIRWIGRRAYMRRFAFGKPEIQPVLIRAGALGENVPRRDLSVSPQHAIFIDGLLIPAIRLINGVSIVQADEIKDVHYVHIELDRHDIILAEGAPSESFEDDDSRMIFHNAHEFFALYPDAPRRPAAFCAPRVNAGPEVAAIRERLACRAGLRPRLPVLRGAVETVTEKHIGGWAEHPEHPQALVCLDVLVDGVLLAQTLAHPGRGFSLRPPVTLTPRQLAGVEVRRSLDQAVLRRVARAA
jgi:hypothetical protein